MERAENKPKTNRNRDVNENKTENESNSETEDSEDPEEHRVNQTSLRNFLEFLGKSKNEKNMIKGKILKMEGNMQTNIKRHISKLITNEDAELLEKYMLEELS